MAKKYGYNETKCDALKKDRKNLTNKLYRRRQKIKKLTDPKEISKTKRQVDQLKNKVNVLNSRVWKCSKQYYDLKIKENSIKSKISYRTKKLKSLNKGTKAAKKTKSEIAELKLKTKKLESKIFRGSDKYQNLKVNLIILI